MNTFAVIKKYSYEDGRKNHQLFKLDSLGETIDFFRDMDNPLRKAAFIWELVAEDEFDDGVHFEKFFKEYKLKNKKTGEHLTCRYYIVCR